MVDSRRLATNCGPAAGIVGVGAVLIATLVASPETFTWRGRALSDMGRAGAETFVLFNGGLILAGLLGLPFGWRLWRTARNAFERAGVALLGVTVVGLVGVGVFFLEHTEYYLDVSMHAPAALAVFAGTPLAQWVYGAGQLRAGDRRRARVSLALGAVHVVNWVGWVVFLETVAAEPSAWFAVPEFVAACSLGVWIVLLARWIRADAGP